MMKIDYWLRTARDLAECERGVALVELAFIASILTVLAVGTFEYASAIHQTVQLQQAARVGAEFAIKYPSDETGILNAITGATGNNSDNMSITVTPFCECPDGVSIACTDTCSGGVSPNLFLQVAIAQPASSALSTTGLMPGYTLHATATMRAK